MATLGRVPTRPMDYSSRQQAVNKELLADYNNGHLYIKGSNGELYNVGRSLFTTATIPNDGTNATAWAATEHIIRNTVPHNEYELTLGAGNTGVTVADDVTFTFSVFETMMGSSYGTYIFEVTAVDTSGDNVTVSWELADASITISEYGIQLGELVESTWAVGDTVQIVYSRNNTYIEETRFFSAPFTKTVAIPQIRATDIVKISLNATPEYNVEVDTASNYVQRYKALVDQFNQVYAVTSADGSITLYASHPIGVPLPILVEYSR